MEIWIYLERQTGRHVEGLNFGLKVIASSNFVIACLASDISVQKMPGDVNVAG